MPVIEYKCGGCGSSMIYDTESGMLSCESCGRKDHIKNIRDPIEQWTFREHEAKEYHCNSCGAVLITDAETAATSCSFCGSNVVLGDRLAGKRMPAKIIPFSISKEEAIQAFRKWCKNGLLTPSDFMTADRIQSMTGIYVPFWLYDLDYRIEIQARGTKVRSYHRGQDLITETSYYDIYRKMHLSYTKVPVDAAEKMNDELMDKLEPFSYDKLKTFKTAYLAGYVAEKYSYDDQELLPRAKEKVSKYIDSYIRSAMEEFASVTYQDKRIDARGVRAEYVLLPVWAVHYHYNKKTYTFAMNGQTGKVAGKPPISKMKVSAWFGGIFGASFLTLKLASWIIGGGIW